MIIKGSFKAQKKYPSSLPPKKMIGQFPEDIGTRVADQTINDIAFACSPRLKTVAQATTYLHQCGLEINPVKSHTIGIMVYLHLDCSQLSARRKSRYTLMTGKINRNQDSSWNEALVLKPQQKLLWYTIVSQLYHQFTLENMIISELNKLNGVFHPSNGPHLCWALLGETYAASGGGFVSEKGIVTQRFIDYGRRLQNKFFSCQSLLALSGICIEMDVSKELEEHIIFPTEYSVLLNNLNNVRIKDNGWTCYSRYSSNALCPVSFLPHRDFDLLIQNGSQVSNWRIENPAIVQNNPAI
ncbi:hypothetical protein HZH68_016143 [Vespula germanica]|uniref:Uncharacterized protein n=1 Tax=Vespula germanica TaxID=30212 RepID=A0A834J3F3_VESGE|nr:hypothetical protein HZH68_016143 [Vespula germanica]